MRKKDPSEQLLWHITLHIAKDMQPVYRVEVHPHAENSGPQVCATKRIYMRASSQRKQKADVLNIYNMSCLLCSMQMFNLVYISAGIQNTVSNKMHLLQKRYLMKVMFTLYQYQYGN